MSSVIDFAFLDSGTGGIPYMLSLKEKDPNLRCVYLGDTEHFPYGEKTSQEVTDCASCVIEKIIRCWNPRLLVIACNTMSVTSLESLRKNFPLLPIVGTVPAIKLAAKVTQNRRIGLLATNATVSHPYCEKLISDFASGYEVFKRGDPNLIDFIEHDLFTATKEEKLKAVEPSVLYFTSLGCDTIILGCTHFTHIASVIKEAFEEAAQKVGELKDKKVFVVDSRDGVSNHALEVLKSIPQKTEILPPIESIPDDMSFFVTKLKQEKERREYETLCKNFKIPFGGVLE